MKRILNKILRIKAEYQGNGDRILRQHNFTHYLFVKLS